MANTEPTTIIAGFSYDWKRTLPAHASATHALRYVIRRQDGQGKPVTITAAPEGVASYTATITPLSTAKLEPGAYFLSGYITDDATSGQVVRVQIYGAALQVLADPAIASGDQRSFARRMVDSLRETLLKLATNQLDSASVNGKNYNRRNMAELRSELFRFEEILKAEEGSTGDDRNIYVRFNRT